MPLTEMEMPSPLSVLKRPSPAKTLPSKEQGMVTLAGRTLSYTITRSHRRKRTIMLRVELPHSLIIHASMRAKTERLLIFIESKQNWIFNRLAEKEKRAEKKGNWQFSANGMAPYLGQPYPIVLQEQGKMARSFCTLNESESSLLFSLSSSLTEKEQEYEIARLLKHWYRSQAEKLLSNRLEEWSRKLKIPYSKFLLVDVSSYWGSCDSRHKIRLNWRLVMTPHKVIDYVIIHELCHTVHPDHSIRFWRYVAGFLPDYKNLRSELNSHDDLLSRFRN